MTEITSELPVRPRPTPTESLLGFVMRVMNANGYEGQSAVKKIFHIAVMQLGNLSVNSIHFPSLQNLMQKRLRLADDEIKHCFKNEWDGLYDGNRFVADYSIRKPRVCLACLAENQQVDRTWRFAHITHCHIHKQPLFTCCPQCNSAFTWSPELLEKCPKCELVWSKVLIESQPTPLWLQYEKSLKPALRARFIDDLYEMAAIAMRFYDMQFTRFRSLPNDISNIHGLFDFSFRLLVDADYREVQFKSRVTFWCINGDFKVLNGRSLQFLNRHWTDLRCRPNDIQLENNLKVNIDEFQTAKISSTRKSTEKSKLNWHFQLESAEAAHLLSVKMTDVAQLAKLGFFKLHAYQGTDLYRLTNVRDIDTFLHNFLKKLHKIENRKELVTVSEMAAKLSRFKFGIADIINLIYRGVFKGFAAEDFDGVTITSILVHREEVINELEQQFIKTLSHSIHRVPLQKYYFVSQQQFEKLNKFYFRELEDHPTGNSCISAESVKRFEQQFLVLNRWCYMRDISISEVVKKLSELRIEPSLSPSISKNMHVYQKSDYLIFALAELIEQHTASSISVSFS
ncbi:TniQ family protein [Rheinheimera aquimaris]|uniref:TniQ family protein n=1 Tax=Rheinheimera aquimaris TaxID=412437 RepID=UPI0010647428|nr:TniQ family protein [Rheinheimera aquimaris]